MVAKLPAMTTPAELKYTIQRGATFRKRLTWKGYPYPVDVRDGVAYKRSDGARAPDSDLGPINLTGCEIYMPIRAKMDDTTDLLMLSTINGLIVNGGVAGTIDMHISDEASGAIVWTAGVFPIDVAHPGGDVSRIAIGSIAVSKGKRFA